MKLSLTKIRSGWRVTREYYPGDLHCHFNNEDAAKKFMHLMKRGIKPKNSWFLEAARRILTDEEYHQLKTQEKQKYYNKSGMNRRVI